jgi:hypothetical protein
VVENNVARSSIASPLAVADGFANLRLAMGEVVKLVVQGGTSLILEGSNAHFATPQIVKVGVGHVGNRIPVTCELHEKITQLPPELCRNVLVFK